jgi:PleD family two-component response regulator
VIPEGETCSAGVASWNRREGPETLVNRADDALYRAKREGRDRVVSDA